MAKEPTPLADLLRAGQKMLVFTGAGISTGSGIPDFRGPEGVWKRRQPVYYHDFMRSEAARIEHWDYKLEGWTGFRDARPNAVHFAIVELERAGKVRAVVTQNIDGLHARAGTLPEHLIELHGTNSLVECQSCGKRSDPAPHFELFQQTRRPPLCECGGFLKPATISFGQNLRNEDLQRAHDAAIEADLVVALAAEDESVRSLAHGADDEFVSVGCRGTGHHTGIHTEPMRVGQGDGAGMGGTREMNPLGRGGETLDVDGVGVLSFELIPHGVVFILGHQGAGKEIIG